MVDGTAAFIIARRSTPFGDVVYELDFRRPDGEGGRIIAGLPSLELALAELHQAVRAQPMVSMLERVYWRPYTLDAELVDDVDQGVSP